MYTKYQVYLDSKEWKKRRKYAYNFHGNVCFVCETTTKLHVHHGTYRRLGKEKMKDLFILCKNHHFQLHDRHKQASKNKPRDLLKYTKRYIRRERKKLGKRVSWLPLRKKAGNTNKKTVKDPKTEFNDLFKPVALKVSKVPIKNRVLRACDCYLKSMCTHQ
jgi:hypothetical protein